MLKFSGGFHNKRITKFVFLQLEWEQYYKQFNNGQYLYNFFVKILEALGIFAPLVYIL